MLESANKYIVTISSIILLITLCITLYNWFKVRKCQKSLDILNARLSKMDASAKRFQNICTSNMQAMQYSMESKLVQVPSVVPPVPTVPTVPPVVPKVAPQPPPVQGGFMTPDFFEPVRTTTFVISSKNKATPPMQSIIEEIDTEGEEDDEMEEVENVKDLDLELEAELEELEK